ncbi:MAG: gyrase subunit [Planctomycetaceae bacterium]|nr:gyrase subunit [Planctomycetaceae bacterium]
MEFDPKFFSYAESIRLRAPMYVGSKDLFGLINYLVCPVALSLSQRATAIAVTVDEAITVQSDAPLAMRLVDGRLAPFEEITLKTDRHSYEATVLNALSEELTVCVRTAQHTERACFQKGILISHEVTAAESQELGTTLRFKPDPEIFQITEVSAAIFLSYFRRLSFLHSGTRFSFTAGGTTQHFYTENGIRDLFQSITAPYQLMHQPIHFVGQEGLLRLELSMAYHSWSDHHFWCFINNGRAVQGGTHEDGLLLALKQLKKKLKLPEHFHNGMIAVASIQYPEAVWQGCIKAKIGNPELKSMVAKLVVSETEKWLQDQPAVASQIAKLQTFQFPEAWSHSL